MSPRLRPRRRARPKPANASGLVADLVALGKVWGPLVLALAGSAGVGVVQEHRGAQRVADVRDSTEAETDAKVRGASDNSATIINALVACIDSLDVRQEATEAEVKRLRRALGIARSSHRVDTVVLATYDAATYGPRTKPPGFFSRLLGRGGE